MQRDHPLSHVGHILKLQIHFSNYLSSHYHSQFNILIEFLPFRTDCNIHILQIYTKALLQLKGTNEFLPSLNTHWSRIAKSDHNTHARCKYSLINLAMQYQTIFKSISAHSKCQREWYSFWYIKTLITTKPNIKDVSNSKYKLYNFTNHI